MPIVAEKPVEARRGGGSDPESGGEGFRLRPLGGFVADDSRGYQRLQEITFTRTTPRLVRLSDENSCPYVSLGTRPNRPSAAAEGEKFLKLLDHLPAIRPAAN